jgi:hypothetical protein
MPHRAGGVKRQKGHEGQKRLSLASLARPLSPFDKQQPIPKQGENKMKTLTIKSTCGRLAAPRKRGGRALHKRKDF